MHLTKTICIWFSASFLKHIWPINVSTIIFQITAQLTVKCKMNWRMACFFSYEPDIFSSYSMRKFPIVRTLNKLINEALILVLLHPVFKQNRIWKHTVRRWPDNVLSPHAFNVVNRVVDRWQFVLCCLSLFIKTLTDVRYGIRFSHFFSKFNNHDFLLRSEITVFFRYVWMRISSSTRCPFDVHRFNFWFDQIIKAGYKCG